VKRGIAELNEAIRLAPKEAQYRYELGLAWNELGDMNQAIRSAARSREAGAALVPCLV